MNLLKLKKIEKKPNTNNKLTPEIKTVAIQVPTKRMDCPRSGWSISRMIIDANNKKLKRYFTFELCNFLMLKFALLPK